MPKSNNVPCVSYGENKSVRGRIRESFPLVRVGVFISISGSVPDSDRVVLARTWVKPAISLSTRRHCVREGHADHWHPRMHVVACLAPGGHWMPCGSWLWHASVFHLKWCIFGQARPIPRCVSRRGFGVCHAPILAGGTLSATCMLGATWSPRALWLLGSLV